MAESRGGRENAALTGFKLHRPAARPSGRGQIPRSFRQECPWSRYPDMLWYYIYIYIYAFSRLTIAFRLYIFISTCVPWESNPQPFTLLTQCSTTEPHRNTQYAICIHRCLGHRLGSHVQRARSIRGLDGSPNCIGISIAPSC